MQLGMHATCSDICTTLVHAGLKTPSIVSRYIDAKAVRCEDHLKRAVAILRKPTWVMPMLGRSIFGEGCDIEGLLVIIERLAFFEEIARMLVAGLCCIDAAVGRHTINDLLRV